MSKDSASTTKDIIRELQNHKNTLKAYLDRITIGDCPAEALITGAFLANLIEQAKANASIVARIEIAIRQIAKEKNNE